MKLKNKIYNEALREEKKSVLTHDGSLTLYSFEFEEHYHSTTEGALHESLQKHIIPAFSLLSEEKREITILDICFGLGYNTFATLYYILKHKLEVKVTIYSPEFDKSLVESLKNFNYPMEFEPFGKIISTISEKFYYEDEQFKIFILMGDAREEIPKIEQKIDIVYQDAFSFQKNPLLWSKEYFADIKKISSDEVILTTYSSSTTVRMGLWENGFKIFIPKGKNVRAGTIASFQDLPLECIDMELKISRNKEAKSIKDSEYK